MMPLLSLYSSATATKSQKSIPLDIFLDGIRDGRWQDIVLPIRTIQDKAERDARKKNAPCVTPAGLFKVRKDDGVEQHSGIIAVDIDDVDDTEELKSLLCTDPRVLAAFVSISGRGLCVLYRINPARHREAFAGISEFLYEQHKVIADPTSVNISRLRFVSYDPHLYHNPNAEKFNNYPKTKPPKKVERVLYAADDFSQILDQIVSRRLNLCENYHEWLRIAFALAHQFGEAGRGHFHIVSQYSAKYDPAVADKQYNACLKHHAPGNQATIATFYYYCKSAGVQLYSERTRKVAYAAASGKKSGLSAETIASNLEKFEGISDALPLVQEVIASGVEIQGEDSLVDQLIQYLRQNYSLRRNAITRYVEDNGETIKQVDLNTVFLGAKRIYDKATYELIERIINSREIEEYNPFQDFISQHLTDNAGEGHIAALFASVECDDAEHLLHFGRKWLVSVIASIHGEHSPLMLVLSGEEHGTGKTEFFRRLLPRDLSKKFYAESKLDAGKDDEILMTQKLVIMDDEMGGKSKKESKRLKELTSKQVFTLREPYGRNNVDLQRLAVLCGTTNDSEILNDPTGNRRIIPIHVTSIDHAAYNRVDKTALFMEAYHLFMTGYPWRLDKHDVAYLNKDASKFEVTTAEAELLTKYFEPAEGQYYAEFMSTTEIKDYLEVQTKQKLLLERLGKELKKQGFEKIQKRFGARRVWGYNIKKVGGVSSPYTTQFVYDDPFPAFTGKVSPHGTTTSQPKISGSGDTQLPNN